MISKEKKYEVDNLTGINHEGTLANQPVQRLTATSIIGDGVENNEGEDLGKIDNLMVNLHTGVVEYAVIEFGSFLGMAAIIAFANIWPLLILAGAITFWLKRKSIVSVIR